VKQEFKENIYQVGAKVLPEQLMTYIFEVVKHDPEQLLIRLNQDTTPNDVLKYFINKDIAINSFNEVLPSLNDIFIKLVEDTTTARQFETIQ
jgi:ABC-2 type transport system ATP-binding protein